MPLCDQKKHSVLVHGVKVADFPTDKQEEGMRRIHEQNPRLRSRLRIVRYTRES